LIVRRGARIMGLRMTDDGALEIAKRARGTPRIAGRLLRRVRDFADVAKAEAVTARIADEALTRLDVDSIGLDHARPALSRHDRPQFRRRAGGHRDDRGGLSEPRDAIEDIIEPFLIQQGFMQRTPRGRMMTARAWGHIGLNPPKDLAATQASLFEDE
jgi:Holliday junction DNA helicase RuvB